MSKSARTDPLVELEIQRAARRTEETARANEPGGAAAPDAVRDAAARGIWSAAPPGRRNRPPYSIF
ncbi:MAG: hypothetical protein ABSF86_23505 [Steroidobacteraceae bacterium]|jgi:hypothetical protein